MGFPLGVIEGFYGRQWTWEQREQLVTRLPGWGYHSYIYAPKGDASLRSAWHQPFSKVHFHQLRYFGSLCKEAGLSWGVGFSPAGLQARFNTADRERLMRKLDELKGLELDSLWVLFDDLPAGNPDLAKRQLEVVNLVREQLPLAHMAVCPSYYSEDPILETLFGECPEDYFSDLANGLPTEVDLLWTGRLVISPDYSQHDIEKATLLLGRKPLLWDNYPVNDGRKSSRFLNLYPFRGRPWQLQRWAAGHFVNPMNQFALSSLVLPALGCLYRDGEDYDPAAVFAAQLQELPAELAVSLKRDWRRFQELGLDALDAQQKSTLVDEYERIDHPAAQEVASWLAEGYRFDPDCLTE